MADTPTPPRGALQVRSGGDGGGLEPAPMKCFRPQTFASKPSSSNIIIIIIVIIIQVVVRVRPLLAEAGDDDSIDHRTIGVRKPKDNDASSGTW